VIRRSALLLLSCMLALPALAQTTLNGAGATFPYPMYSKWFNEYHKLHSDIEINYQSIGSGGGIRQVLAGTVDFGASDGPMTDEQLGQSKTKILHVPTVLGAVVPAYNVPGVSGEVKFTPDVIAGIFLGKITNWNDKAIAAANPGVKFPDQSIIVVHRSDGSGTTYIFTDYLSKVSPDWKSKVGVGTEVQFPTGVGGKGNDGVSALLGQTDGAIAYVGAAYAQSNGFNQMAMENAAGNFEQPSLDTIGAAAAAVTSVPANNAISITNPPASATNAYPLASYTWALVPKTSDKGAALKSFLTYAIGPGQAFAAGFLFAKLPAQIVQAAKATINKIGG